MSVMALGRGGPFAAPGDFTNGKISKRRGLAGLSFRSRC